MEDRNKCLREFNMTDASDRLLRVAKISFWLYVGLIVAMLGAFFFMFIGLSADVGSASINNIGVTIAIVAIFAVAIIIGIIIGVMILKYLKKYIVEDKASQAAFIRCKERILNKQYDEVERINYIKDNSYKAMSTIFVIAGVLAALNIFNINMQELNTLNITNLVINVGVSILSLAAYILLYKFIKLRELQSNKIMELAAKVSNMDNSYRVDKKGLDSKLSSNLSVIFKAIAGIQIASALISLGVLIYILAASGEGLELMLTAIATVALLIAYVAIAAILLIKAASYFKYMEGFNRAIEAAIDIIGSDQATYQALNTDNQIDEVE